MMPPLVLLPGMMCDARVFAPQIGALSSVCSLHVPRPMALASMAEQAEAVLAEAPPYFALAGLSMGGILAMEIVARAPDRVLRLALMDTNPLAEAPEIQARRGPQMEKVRAGGLAEVMRDEMKPNYLTDGRRRAEILDLCLEMALALGGDVFCAQSIALRDRPDQQETLRGLKVPGLVLCGRADRLCPVERHLLMHRLIPGSVLHIVEEAGHLPCLEQPEETTTALRRWMEA
jgi:pimeloyl-ACP methyl ester carboxylesterase